MKITGNMLAKMANYTIARSDGSSEVWIYLGDKDNERYVIGVPKKENILVIGVNPGMSMPGEKRITTNKVTDIIEKKFGEKYGWIMVNLHPQRSSNPKDIKPNYDMEQNNLVVIEYIVKQFNIKKIWCAWGNSIDKVGNGFLRQSWEKIYNAVSELEGTVEWYHYGKLTKKVNPRHPRFVPKDWEMLSFNPDDYVDALKKKMR